MNVIVIERYKVIGQVTWQVTGQVIRQVAGQVIRQITGQVTLHWLVILSCRAFVVVKHLHNTRLHIAKTNLQIIQPNYIINKSIFQY